MGCHTEPAAVHIAHVLQRLHFFQFFNFFYNLHDLPQKEKIQFFFIIHTTYSKNKKITRIYSQKNKITRLDGFFVHDLHFSRNLVKKVDCNKNFGKKLQNCRKLRTTTPPPPPRTGASQSNSRASSPRT